MSSNPFIKFWKYLTASLNSKIEEKADPKIQLQQALEDSQKKHTALREQAASIIGNRRKIEMDMEKVNNRHEELNGQVRQALSLADKANNEGNTEEADEYTKTAEILAGELVSVEEQLESLKNLHEQNVQAAEQAQNAVKENEYRLKEQQGQYSKLVSQLEQTKMQEQVNESLNSIDSSLAPSGNTPTLDQVRDKIERRYSNALGASELARNSTSSKMVEVQESSAALAGKARLEQIRAGMGQEEKPAVSAAKPAQPAKTPTISPNVQAKLDQLKGN